MKVQLLLYDGFDELDAVAPFEALRMAGWPVEFVTLDGAEEVTAARGLHVRTGGVRLDVAARPELLLVPGGGWVDRSPRGAWAEAQRGAIPAVLQRAHAAGVVIAAVCTGGMLLAAAGLLRDRPAVTHHGALEDLRDAGAQVVRARVVDDGDIVTAGGVTSGLDLALWLIERFDGPQAAHRVEDRLEYERRGVVWRRPG